MGKVLTPVQYNRTWQPLGGACARQAAGEGPSRVRETMQTARGACLDGCAEAALDFNQTPRPTACNAAQSSGWERPNPFDLKELRVSQRFFLIESPFTFGLRQVKSVEKTKLFGFVELFSMFWLYHGARYNGKRPKGKTDQGMLGRICQRRPRMDSIGMKE